MAKKGKKRKNRDETSDSDLSHPGTPVSAEKQRKNSGCDGVAGSPEGRNEVKRRLSYEPNDMTPCK